MRADGCRCHSTKHEGANGSTPCGSAPMTPRIALSKWKLAVLQVNYRKRVGFPIETSVFGGKLVGSDCRRGSHAMRQTADGSTPCGSAPTSPRIAFIEWKLAELQVDHRPKVGVFWVFPYKMGIERRRSTTVHTTDGMADIPCGM